MNLLLDVIDKDTGEMRGEIRIDSNLLRVQRGVLLQKAEDIAELQEGSIEDIRALDGLIGMIDSILDVAEEGAIR